MTKLFPVTREPSEVLLIDDDGCRNSAALQPPATFKKKLKPAF